jgi:hypothetical protein
MNAPGLRATTAHSRASSQESSRKTCVIGAGRAPNARQSCANP